MSTGVHGVNAKWSFFHPVLTNREQQSLEWHFEDQFVNEKNVDYLGQGKKTEFKTADTSLVLLKRKTESFNHKIMSL